MNMKTGNDLGLVAEDKCTRPPPFSPHYLISLTFKGP
jgi:hypothetical protein